jgi:hypothetical protein
MTLRTISILVLTIVFFTSCSIGQNQRPNSRVSYFQYGGYGDIIYSTLEGEIFYLDTSLKTKDSITQLTGVAIKILENDKTLLSDSNGQFVINLDKGVFSLLLTKDGFQPLLIKNYVSDPDQYSRIKIYLEKGKEQQAFMIPKSGTE